MKYVLKLILKSTKVKIMLLGYLVTLAAYQFMNNELINIINQAVQNPGSMNGVNTFIIAIVICAIIKRVMQGCYLAKDVIYTDLANTLINKVLDLEPKAFEYYSVAKVNTMVTKIKQINSVFFMAIEVFANVCTIVVVLVAIHRIDSTATLPVITVVLILTVVIKIVIMKWREIDHETDRLAKERNAELSEVIRGFKEVRFFNAVERHRSHLTEINRTVYNLCVKRGLYASALGFIGEFGNGVLSVAGLLYGLMMINSGVTNAATIVSLLMFVWRLIQPFFNIIKYLSEFSQFSVAVKDFAEFMVYENSIIDGRIKLGTFENDIVFDDVSFEYDSSNTVLNHIDLTIKRGQKVGICGESGGGKSTLLNLLMRSRDVCSGSIKIDGIDIRKLDLNSYRHEIGIVSQDIYIFDTNILENIRYAVPLASRDEVIEACKKANLWDFVKKLPEGLETYVGSEGLKLSGGQKQRISLARIFLKDPEIILLDEATSALDNVSERAVKKSLKLLDGKTIIAVAHRLTTIQNYDKIIVIGNHKILAEGTHDELIQSCKTYREMNKAEENDEK